MYRGSQESFAETIERLEREVAELRAALAPGRRREVKTRLFAALCGMLTFLALAACAAARARADQLTTRFDAEAAILERKTRDLGTCESMVRVSQDDFRACVSGLPDGAGQAARHGQR